MKTIHLYGALKDRIGPSVRLEVNDAAEAIRAIVTTRPEADDVLRSGSFVLVRRKVDTKSGRILASMMRAAIEDTDYQLDAEMMHLALGSADLHIIPVVGGEGGRGIGKVLLGAAMIAGAWVAAPTLAVSGAHLMGMQAFGFLGMSVSYGALASMGAMMALGGVSQILSKAPSASAGQNKNESFIFSGPANVGSQGSSVPVVHGGPIRTGSVTVSSSVTTVSIGSGGLFQGIKGTVLDALDPKA